MRERALRDRRDKIRYHTVLNYVFKRRSKIVSKNDTLEITCVLVSSDGDGGGENPWYFMRIAVRNLKKKYMKRGYVNQPAGDCAG